MAAPREFTLESVRDFVIERGGRVTNHELVKHFKPFLTDPYTKEYARVQFKEFVNVLATIRQEDNGEKYLVLKSKFYPANVSYSQPPEPQWPASPSSYEPSMLPPPPPIPSMGTPEATGLPVFRAPPPYRPPPEPLLPAAAQQRRSIESMPPPPPPPVMARQSSFPTDDFIPASAYLLPTLQQQQQKQSQPPPAERAVSVQDLTSTTPAVPPRRLKSQHSADDKENFSASAGSLERPASHNEEVKISVKERTQRFNKMASQVDLLSTKGNGAASVVGGAGANAERRDSKSKVSGEDDDTSSLATMEPRSKEWMLATARGDYHAIARLLREEPRLAKRRDFVTTGLHWAAKHGNDALVKMLAGTYKSDVNARTNAGCTPLHISAQQGHEDVFDLLVKTYGADSNLRDYSGKKPYQYFPRRDSVISTDTFRKITAKRNLAAEKEAAVAAGFLRIGSLNVRVKKTTEAFNQLLSSAGSAASSSIGSTSAKMMENLLGGHGHNKAWGSVDNLPSSADGQMMPPPAGGGKLSAPTKKKRPKDWSSAAAGQPLISGPTLIHHTHSTSFSMAGPLSTIQQQQDSSKDDYDNDSDSAYGFGNGWQS